MSLLDEWSPIDGENDFPVQPLTSVELEEAALLSQFLPSFGQVAAPYQRLHPLFHQVVAHPPSPLSPPRLSASLPASVPPPESPEESWEASTTAEGQQGLEEGEEAGALVSESPPPFHVEQSRNVYVDLPKSTLATPRSRHEGFVPPAPSTKERHAVAALIEALKAQADPSKLDFIEFDIDQFAAYIHREKIYSYEMRTLSSLETKKNSERFFFDGVLSYGELKFWVERIEVAELPIGNYGVSNPTVGDQIWVRSLWNAGKDIYYKLGKPAVEYQRFHRPFLWVADLGKHVIDFSSWLIQGRREVHLESFRKDFLKWLVKLHGQHQEFQQWRKQHPSTDFRNAVNGNIEYIWKEMNGVLGAKTASSLTLFRETMYFNQYKATTAPPLPLIRQGQDQQEAPTIVTPYVKECFGHMVLGKVLQAIGKAQPNIGAPLRCAQLSQAGFVGRRGWVHLPAEEIDKIQIGDTISTPRDGETTDTKWRSIDAKDMSEDPRWFGRVQKVHVAKDGFRSFDVSWFYRPVDTPCCMMKYPWPNELFFSDHCTCEEGREKKVQETEVLAVHNFDWFVGPEKVSDKDNFFVRQMYIVEHRRWVTLERSSHLNCSHQAQKHSYKSGDTVLAVINLSDNFSEPYEVVKVFKQGAIVFVRLRKLLRRQRVDPSSKAAPNELLYTEKFVVVKLDKIVGRCVVRFFPDREAIPSPYNRNGTGNLFYITHLLDERGGCPAYVDIPISLRQGFDPYFSPRQKLKGLDLFCGAGNLGRGLEDSGIVDMLWANDISEKAIHTYMVNASKETHPFLGSVDDLLRLAIEGKYADNIPKPGDVDLISAGSPCPGFSLLTLDKSTLHQIKNQSLVASFAAFVDFYRPKYAILENVTAIVQTTHNQNQDTLSQLFCAIVGLGYQAQLIMGDAWSHGAPQRRSRVFLFVAAPGLQLPEAPAPSHSHFPNAGQRSLGKLCTDEPYVRRPFTPTPFKYVSALEATGDLPRLDDGKTASCISFPDHRVVVGLSKALRAQINAIPTHPYGLNFVKAWKGGNGVMSASDRGLFPGSGQVNAFTTEKGASRVVPTAQGWSRIKPSDVFATVTTALTPSDARTPKGLHWIEPRPLSLMEVRRAQGFLDEEVLLGLLRDRWRLVGNSVARQMSLALGLKLREAWVGSLYDDGFGDSKMPHRPLANLCRSWSETTREVAEVKVKRFGMREPECRESYTESRSRTGTPGGKGIATPNSDRDTNIQNRRKRRSSAMVVEVNSPKKPRKAGNDNEMVVTDEEQGKHNEEQRPVADEVIDGVTILTLPELEQENMIQPADYLRNGPTIVRIGSDDEDL